MRNTDSTATLGQSQHVIKLINDMGLTRKQLSQLLNSGIFADLLKASKQRNLKNEVARGAVQRALGLLEPIERQIPSVVSGGNGGEYWVDRIQDEESEIGFASTPDVLHQEVFDEEHVTENIEYCLSVIKGDEVVPGRCKSVHIRHFADTRGLSPPPAEVALLLLFSMSFEDFKRLERQGIKRLIVMHEPIDVGGSQRIFNLYLGEHVRWIQPTEGDYNAVWTKPAETGFVFVRSSERIKGVSVGY